MRYPPPLKERFDQSYQRSGMCWEWSKNVDKEGYGRLTYNNKTKLAHRISWLLFHGEEPSLLVLHKCDNRKCVNPSHLYLGDHKQNSKDAVERVRLAAQRVTHCPGRHEYNDTNTRIYRGRRYCRACDKARRKEKPVWQE